MAQGDINLTIVGNLTNDPELRFTASGQALASFGLAVNRRWQNRSNQEWEEQTSFFNIVRAHNTGAAFSFLAGAAGWQRWFFVGLGAVAAVFIVWMLRNHAGQKLFCWALALILGGALGNVIDRLLHGHVVDFIQVHWNQHYFPSFNVADSAISIGAALLILDELRRVRRAS
mgnify:CR=1 FL=1